MGAFDGQGHDTTTSDQFPTAEEIAGNVAVAEAPAETSRGGGKRTITDRASPRPAEPTKPEDFLGFEDANPDDFPAGDPGDEDDSRGKGKRAKADDAEEDADADAGESKISKSLRAEAKSWGFEDDEIEALGSETAVMAALRREIRRQGETVRGQQPAKGKAAAEEEDEKEEDDLPLTDAMDDDTKKVITQSRTKLTKMRTKFEAKIEKQQKEFNQYMNGMQNHLLTMEFDAAVTTDPALRQVLGEELTDDMDENSDEHARRVRLAKAVLQTRAGYLNDGKRPPTVKALTKRLAGEMFAKEIGAIKNKEATDAARDHGRRAQAARPSGGTTHRELPPGKEKAAAYERTWWNRAKRR